MLKQRALFDKPLVALPGQGCAAVATKSSSGPRRRFIEFALFATEGDLVSQESSQRYYRSTVVLAAAVAVAVAYLEWRSVGFVAY
jgi:hypothetical protein